MDDNAGISCPQAVGALGKLGPPGVDPAMFSDQVRQLLTVDEAVRRYREAATEAQSTRMACEAAFEAFQNAERRANAAQVSAVSAGEDLRRAITEAAP